MGFSRRLTIAIPTYNRYSDLRIALGSIKKQLSNLDNKISSLIHIHVQDNASIDNTSNYLMNSLISSEIKNTGALFTYKINSENFGFDINFEFCVKNALSEYVWVISDDDIIFEDIFEQVLIILKKDLSLVNLSFEQIPFCSRDQPIRLNSYSEKYLSDKSFYSIMYFPKLSVFIFKTELAKKVLPKLNHDTLLMYLELALRIALDPNTKCFYSNLFIGKDISFFTHKKNDYSPYIFNNRYILVKKLLNEFGRDDLISVLQLDFAHIVDPIITTLKLLIFKNLNMHNVKKSVLVDCKKRLNSQKDLIKYMNFSLIIFYLFGWLSSYLISTLIKVLYSIKFFTIRIFFNICRSRKILKLFLKERKIFPKNDFLKRVDKPNNIVLIGKYLKKDLVINFKNDSFNDSQFFIFNDLKLDNIGNPNNFNIKTKNKLKSNNSLILYSDNNSNNYIYIKLSESNDLKKINTDIYTIEDYLLDIKAIPRIDLLCINANNLQLKVFKEFELLVRFTNFIVIDFSPILSSNINQLYSIIKTLENNNHKVYFKTQLGLIPITNLKLKIYGIPIKLISILKA